jgi:trk system potassium uptake protein TrkA
VIGVDRFGTALVEALWRGRCEVVAVDLDAENIEGVREHTSHAFVGDATNPRVLEGLDAASMDAAVVTFGTAFEATVMIVASLRRLAVRRIIARVETRRQAEILELVGATRVLQIEAEMGERLGRELLSPVATELMDLSEHYHVVPWRAHGPLVGRTLAEAQLRRRFELTVLGYRREDPADKTARGRITIATPDYRITEGDTLLLVGEDHNVAAFYKEAAAG